jgi:hypothetical protein
MALACSPRSICLMAKLFMAIVLSKDCEQGGGDDSIIVDVQEVEEDRAFKALRLTLMTAGAVTVS